MPEADSAGPTVHDYYRNRDVRARVREYCSIVDPERPGCVYLAAMTGREGPCATWFDAVHEPPEALDRLLDAGADVARSLWDRENLLVFLDVDYLNPDRPGEAFVHPADIFLKLEPVYSAVMAQLGRHALPLMPVMTGEGYHFVGRVPWNSPTIRRLAELAPEAPAWLDSVRRRHPRVRDAISERQARAYTGLALVMEHLAHAVIRESFPATRIPVVLNGTIVGRGEEGRECISLDLTFAGDPLDMRHVRAAFSTYQRHRWREDMFGSSISTTVPPLVALPRVGPLSEMLSAGRGTKRAMALASSVKAGLPLVTSGMESLIDDYRGSPTMAAHRRFYADAPVTPEQWAGSFDGYDYRSLPPCVATSLLNPNDRLLQPAHIQHVTRAFLGMGWPPRRIASMIQSRYALDFGWGERWERMHAATKADADVRAFATILFVGLDRLIDFNCVSAQEKGLCPFTGCGRDLRVDRDHLLKAVAA